MIRAMKNAYVEKRNGGYRVVGTRISLDSIIYAFKRGASPETIKRSFPLLSLEEVYGALTFYLANQKKIDTYLVESEEKLNVESKARRDALRKAKPRLVDRLKNEEVVVR